VILCVLHNAPQLEDVWRSGGIALPFFSSPLDGIEWSASGPGRFVEEKGLPVPFVKPVWKL
jgi:hypothetical protein